MLGVISIVFVILHLSGNPALLLAPQNATAHEIHRIEIKLGLNKPLYMQYLLYLWRLLHGNFGFSYAANEPALYVVMTRAPYSLVLAGAAMLIALFIGVPMGLFMAKYKGSTLERILMMFVVAGQSLPAFWTGLLLITLFSVDLHLVPSSGASTPQALILPAVTLASVSLAAIARMTRASVLSELHHDYVRTAQAKGVSSTWLFVKHVLRNAAVPIITVITLELANLLGGAVITETIFAWPGLGQLTVQSVSSIDIPVVETIVLLGSAVYIGVNFLADVLYTLVDPRIGLGDMRADG